MVKYILSLAGGGIRGAITVSFLKHLQTFLKYYNGNTLYDQFDIFTGSSTGALICGGIAYGQLDAFELVNRFYTYDVAKTIMNKTWTDYLFGFIQNRPKYDGVGKRKVIESITRGRLVRDTQKDVIIPIYDITKEDPVFIKSWDTQTNKLYIADVLDATSAAPCYFPSVEYKPGSWAIDGSVISHNPAMIAYLEAKEKYPGEEIVILSIGTGQGFPDRIGRESQHWGSLEWAINGNLFDLVINAPMEADIMQIEKLTKLNGDKIIHIDGYVRHTSMDDISEKNIEILKEVGTQLWEGSKDKVKELFGYKQPQITETESVFL